LRSGCCCMVHVAVLSATSYGLRFGVNFSQTAGLAVARYECCQHHVHVASVIWQPMLSQSRGIDWKVVAGDQCEGKYTEEPWLVKTRMGSHMQ
jgi:hypothetical protein